MKIAPEWQPLFEAGREMLAEAAAEEQGELAAAAAAAANGSSSSSASPLSRVPRAAAPFVYLSPSSASASGDDSVLLLVPTIDLVVSSVLMSLGMMMMSPTIVSLPFKLLLFVLVDGWSLLLGSLAASFG